MKKILLLISLTLVMFPALAANSVLNLNFPSHAPRTIVFNGHVFNEHGSNFTLSNLTTGYHNLEVYQNRGHRGRHSQTLLYRGRVFIPAGSNVVASIYQPHRLITNSVTPIRYHNVYTPVPAPVYMNNHQFGMVMSSVSRTSFDNTRLSIAMQAIRANGVTSSQVLSLMNLLSFESNRLQLAKFAYEYTADPQNYYMVNDGFSFSSSISDLDRFIRGY